MAAPVNELEKCFKNLNVADTQTCGKVKEPEKEVKYLESLQELECPFTWKINFVSNHKSDIERIEEKLLEMVDEDEELKAWKSFVLNLVLCYEYCKQENFVKGGEALAVCEENLKEQNQSGSSPIMGVGLRHITLASKCFLIHKDDNTSKEEIDKILPDIVPLGKMSPKDASSVHCLRGSFCTEYGYEGTIESVKFIEAGLCLYDKCPEWHFLLGRSLGRLRRIENRNEIPDKKELNALEKAATLSDNASFYVALATVYREAARNVFFSKKKQGNLKSIVDMMNKKALDLTTKVLSKERENPHVYIRCAMTLMKLPYPLKKMELAGSCITKALKHGPNSPMVLHYSGKFYHASKDFENAMKYYEKAIAFNVFGAEIDCMVLKKERNPSYDPLPDLLKLLEKYHEKPRRISILCYLGNQSYYEKRNFQKAFQYWSQAIEINISSSVLQATYDNLVGKKINRSVNEVMITEMLCALKDEKVGEEDKEKYESIIKKFKKDAPEIFQDVKRKIYV